MISLGKYAKSVAALVTGTLGWFAYVISANPNHFTVSNPQWLALGVAVATALGVYGVPNTTPAPVVVPPQPPLPAANLPAPVAPWVGPEPGVAAK